MSSRLFGVKKINFVNPRVTSFNPIAFNYSYSVKPTAPSEMPAKRKVLSMQEWVSEAASKGHFNRNLAKSEGFLKLAVPEKSEPYELLHYSRNKDFEVVNDRSEATVLNLDKGIFGPFEKIPYRIGMNEITKQVANVTQKIDLSAGYKNYINHKATKKDLGATKIAALHIEEHNRNQKLDFDFLCSRHSMVKLVQTVLRGGKEKFNLLYFDGQIFMEVHKVNRWKTDPSTMCGHNMEALVTGPLDLDKDPIYTPASSNVIKYNCLCKHDFPEHNISMVVSSEIDCISQPYTGDENEYDVLKKGIELKCNKNRNYISQAFLQCYLAGTPTLLSGIKNDDFTLKLIEKYNINEVLAAEQDQFAYLQKYLDKLLLFLLLFIKKSVLELGPGKPYHPVTFVMQLVGGELRIKSKRFPPDLVEKYLLSSFILYRQSLKKELRNVKKESIKKQKEEPVNIQ